MNFFREAELKEPVQKAHAFRLDDQATVQLRLQIRQAPRLKSLLHFAPVFPTPSDLLHTPSHQPLFTNHRSAFGLRRAVNVPGDVGATGDVDAARLRPSFETPEASSFAKASADTSSGKPALPAMSALSRLQLSAG